MARLNIPKYPLGSISEVKTTVKRRSNVEARAPAVGRSCFWLTSRQWLSFVNGITHLLTYPARRVWAYAAVGSPWNLIQVVLLRPLPIFPYNLRWMYLMVSMMNNININIIYYCNSPKERVHCLHVGNKFYPVNNMATIVGHVFTFSLEKENINWIVAEKKYLQNSIEWSNCNTTIYTI